MDFVISSAHFGEIQLKIRGGLQGWSMDSGDPWNYCITDLTTLLVT